MYPFMRRFLSRPSGVSDWSGTQSSSSYASTNRSCALGAAAPEGPGPAGASVAYLSGWASETQPSSEVITSPPPRGTFVSLRWPMAELANAPAPFSGSSTGAPPSATCSSTLLAGITLCTSSASPSSVRVFPSSAPPASTSPEPRATSVRSPSYASGLGMNFEATCTIFLALVLTRFTTPIERSRYVEAASSAFSTSPRSALALAPLVRAVPTSASTHARALAHPPGRGLSGCADLDRCVVTGVGPFSSSARERPRTLPMNPPGRPRTSRGSAPPSGTTPLRYVQCGRCVVTAVGPSSSPTRARSRTIPRNLPDCPRASSVGTRCSWSTAVEVADALLS